MLPIFSVGLPLLVAILAGEGVKATACNATNPCPYSAPCCSEYGFCGSDHFCLGGCNPFYSHALDSCRPAPVCKDAKYSFKDDSRILTNNTFYEGNATEYDWVVEGGNVFIADAAAGDLALTLTETNGGTKLASTRYVHYGTITARMKTGRWQGVVTAFITMSDAKDEIDWEWPGTTTTEAQSNYFWQGFFPSPSNGGTHGGLSDTYSNFHDYTIDWQPDTLTWLIDGKVVRTVKKSDTVKNGMTLYPTTPARVQFSIWPAGIESSGEGTIAWAGGMINWNDPDLKAAGQFATVIREVTIKCANQQSLVTAAAIPTANITSYVYFSNGTGGVPDIIYTNRSSLLNGASRTALLGIEAGRWQLAVVGFTALAIAGSQAFFGL